MKLILVGVGGTARELIRRLAEMWEITVIDTSPGQIAAARGIRPFREMVGDGSSRVVLARAGLEQADAFVAATDDDATNLEACRLAREAGLLRVMAVGNDPESVAGFLEKGVAVVSPDSLTARRIELALETRRVASASFADGRVEVIEFRIERDSPVRGKAVRELHARNWTVGAVLRGDRLIAHDDETTLETGDLVTIVGAGADFGEILQAFTTGEARFPLDYGKRVAVTVEGEADLKGRLPEAVYLARNSRASSVLLVHRDPLRERDADSADRLKDLIARAEAVAEGVEVRHRPLAGSPSRALPGLPGEESVGVLVLPAPTGRSLLPWLASRRVVRLVRHGRIPVLLSRGTHRYERILIPARLTPPGRAAARAAIDLARFTGGRIDALASIDLVFTSGPEAAVEARAAVDWLKGEAAMQGVAVEGIIRRGNPVKAFLGEAPGKNLLVLGIGRRASALFGTEIPGHIVRRASCSVLLVPGVG
jgi:trk/ktr system potassium uptake protein